MSVTDNSKSRRQRRPDPLETPLLLSVPTAAHLLGIGPTYAWQLVRSGKLPHIRLARRVLVLRADVDRLIRELRNGEGDPS